MISKKEVKNKQMFVFLMLLTCAVSFAFQGWRTLFNNFAVEIVSLDAFQVGAIQSAREVPGLMSLLVVFLLWIIKEHNLAIWSVILLGIGVACTGFFPSFIGLLLTTFVMSVGMHYFETVNKSLVLQYFSFKQAPLVLGKQKSWTAIVNIAVGGLIFLLANFITIHSVYLFLGLVVVATGLFALFLNPTSKEVIPQQKKMVFKKKYWLYYVLNFLSGARRQIFVVFAVFIMVQKYHYSIQYVTLLFVINNLITFFVAPKVAKYINLFGEKTVLTVEYLFMTVVFLGYAFIDNAWIMAVLYIFDNIFYSCAIGINTYFHKIADSEDIAPSMAVGFTINHISAIVIPIIGGALWLVNYQIPFILGALFSVFSLFFIRKMKLPLKA